MAIDARVLPVVISLLVVLAIGAAVAVVFQPFGLGGGSGASAESCEWNTTWQENGQTYHDDDCDRLSNTYEDRRGLDPQDDDTDGDGLEDASEIRILATDPLDPDTDGDGVPDGEEDPDGDGLTNAEEVAAGSHPDSRDGDRDGLTDPQELANGTEPLVADTDDDGLDDGVELHLGTDPLRPDSDGDGIEDGNETYTTTTDDPTLGVTVEVTGRGAVANDLSISRNTRAILDTGAVERARVTPLVTLESEDSFESINLTFQYDAGRATNESMLAVFRFDQQLQTFVPLDTTLDRGGDTASAEPEQFGTFVVFDVEVWRDIFGEG